MVENPPVDAGDSGAMGLISGMGRYPGAGNGIPLQYFILESSMREEPDWLHIVHRAAESDATEQLSTQSGVLCISAMAAQTAGTQTRPGSGGGGGGVLNSF